LDCRAFETQRFLSACPRWSIFMASDYGKWMPSQRFIVDCSLQWVKQTDVDFVRFDGRSLGQNYHIACEDFPEHRDSHRGVAWCIKRAKRELNRIKPQQVAIAIHTSQNFDVLWAEHKDLPKTTIHGDFLFFNNTLVWKATNCQHYRFFTTLPILRWCSRCSHCGKRLVFCHRQRAKIGRPSTAPMVK